MSAILKALEQGYEAEDILDYLTKSAPKLGKAISKASRMGYQAKEILGYLSKNTDSNFKPGISQSELQKAMDKSDAERTKYGLTALSALAITPLAAQVGRNAISRALPHTLTQGLNPPNMNGNNVPPNEPAPPPFSPQAQENLPTEQPIEQTLNNASAPPIEQQNITQPTELEQPKEIPTMETREDVLWDALQRGKTKGPDDATSGMLKLAKQMMTTGQIKSKEDFDRFSQIFNEKMSETKSLPKALREAGNEYSKPKEMVQPEVPIETQQDQEIVEPEPIKIEPKSTVATPEGIGEVKAIRNGKAIVEVDGKRHQLDEDELISSPLPEKDLADLFNDVISGIEKETGQEVSKNVDWAGYDPKTGELAYKPHGGDKLYVYDDISPEDAEQLTSLLTLRKTSGENHIGAWEANTKSPIGAAMSKFIKKLQAERGGKGNEYKNRYETLYDALEPAKTASKRKHAQLKKKAKKPRST